MHTRNEPFTKGLLSLAVILMFAAALVAEQAYANLPASTSPTTEFTGGTRDGILLSAETLRKISSFPTLLGRALPLLVEIDVSVDLLLPGERDGRSDDTLQR